MRFSRYFGLALWVASVLVPALTGLDPAAAEAPPPIIRIGTATGSSSLSHAGSTGTPGLVWAGHYLEQEFAKDGTKIEWSHLSGGAQVNEAFASGAIDLGYCGDAPGIIGHAGGLDTRLIVPGQRGLRISLIVPLESGAKSLADLKGKRIAMVRGGPWEYIFAHLVADTGLRESDFQIINLRDPDAQAALLAGGIDGIFGVDAVIVREQHLAKTIWSLRKDDLLWTATSDLFALNDFITKYPETTKRIAKAFIRSAYDASIAENREAKLRLWSEVAVDPAKAYAQLVDEYAGIPLGKTIVPLDDPFLFAHYRSVIDYALKAKLIRKSFTAEDFIAPQYAEAALTELGLQSHWHALDAQAKPLNP